MSEQEQPDKPVDDLQNDGLVDEESMEIEAPRRAASAEFVASTNRVRISAPIGLDFTGARTGAFCCLSFLTGCGDPRCLRKVTRSI